MNRRSMLGNILFGPLAAFAKSDKPTAVKVTPAEQESLPLLVTREQAIL